MTDASDNESASPPPPPGSVEVPAGGYADMTEAEDSTKPAIGNGVLALISVSLMVMVGAAVYVIGASQRAGEDAAEAEARSQDILDGQDPGALSDLLDTGPDSLPLTTDEPASTTTVPEATSTTDAPSSGIDPVVLIDPERVALAFVNRAPGDDYGKAGVVTFEGERIITELRCTRLDLNAVRGVCLQASSDLTESGYGLITDSQFIPTARFGVSDPSRATVSPDGSVVAWTGFTEGHSYTNEGEFSTITQLIAVDRQLGANLETAFTTYDDDVPNYNPDRNYWGVSFIDADRFYATLQTNGTTSIVEGDVKESRIDVRFEDASCPELSPDGSTIVAKEQRGDGFQLVAIDVETGARRDLGETRSVDDQVEWLDADSILYALPNEEEGTAAQPAFDVWVLDIAAGSTPKLLLPFADSPAAP